MGMMSGLGAVESLARAAQGLSQVFRPDATEGQRLDHEGRAAALSQLSAEFALERRSLFDRFVDGLNRLPRPMLALGTLGLFVYAMAEPVGFSVRMEGLGFVPEPLWWLLGAIVGFYFGAREMHYVRAPLATVAMRPEPVQSAWHAPDEAEGTGAEGAGEENAALRDWQGTTY